MATEIDTRAVAAPDFEAMARQIVELTDLALIRDQLQLVWNARGAADVEKIASQLTQFMGVTAGPYVRHLDRSIRALDRPGRP